MGQLYIREVVILWWSKSNPSTDNSLNEVIKENYLQIHEYDFRPIIHAFGMFLFVDGLENQIKDVVTIEYL